MIKRIGIIELATHNEVLVNYCRIFLAAGFDLRVFTNVFNYKQIGQIANNCQWVIQPKEQGDADFLLANSLKLNECDFLVFVTVYKDFGFYTSFKVVPPTALVVHDSITFLSPKKQFLFAKEPLEFLKDTIKYLKHKILNESRRYQKLVDSFDVIVFPSKKMQEYAISKKWVVKPSFILEFAVHENLRYERNKDDTVQIVIPGIISDKSRDYEIVLQAFEKLKTNMKINLILLGKPNGNYGNRIVNSFKNMESEYFSFRFFEEFIDQKVFDEILLKTDFLILPISKYMKYGIFKELNGFTCVSGNVNDMLRFGIPALVPAYYPLEFNQKLLIGNYDDDEDLSHQLIYWIKNKTYLFKRKESQGQIIIYSIPKIAERVRFEIYKFLE